MNYEQVIIRALKHYISEMQYCADVRDAGGDEEARQLFAIEAAEAKNALAHIEK